jgi:hypothetical protein
MLSEKSRQSAQVEQKALTEAAVFSDELNRSFESYPMEEPQQKIEYIRA